MELTQEQKLAARLIKLRGKKTLKAVAQDAGVAQRALYRWENGEQMPTFRSLNRLAQYFKVSTQSLLK